MKRNKPRQHKRRLKSGKIITVNKGVIKRHRRISTPSHIRNLTPDVLLRIQMRSAEKKGDFKKYASLKKKHDAIPDWELNITPLDLSKSAKQRPKKYSKIKDPLILKGYRDADITKDYSLLNDYTAWTNSKVQKPKNYGFMFKSTDWKGLKDARSRDPEFDNADVLAYIDLDKAFREMDAKGVKFSKSQERLAKEYAANGALGAALETMPREAKMFTNLARNANVSSSESGKPKTLKKYRKPSSLPRATKKNTMTFDELEQWMIANGAKR